MALLVAVAVALKVRVFGTETMVDWDEEKLEQVVKQKHSEAEMKKPKTDIVSAARLLFTSPPQL